MKYAAFTIALALLVADTTWAAPPANAPGLSRRPAVGGGIGAAARPTARSGARGQSATRTARARRRASTRRRNPERVERQHPRLQGSGRPQQLPHPLANRPAPAQPHVERMAPHERGMQQRLAQIDAMRDRAIETNDEALLQRADELERLARDHHARFLANKERVAALPESRYGEPDNGGTRLPAGTETNGRQTPPYGQTVSEHARTLGREFGQFTAEQARELGHEFGKANADKTRIFQRPIEPAPTTEPVPTGEPAPTADPEPVPTTEPAPVTDPETVPAPTETNPS